MVQKYHELNGMASGLLGLVHNIVGNMYQQYEIVGGKLHCKIFIFIFGASIIKGDINSVKSLTAGDSILPDKGGKGFIFYIIL